MPTWKVRRRFLLCAPALALQIEKQFVKSLMDLNRHDCCFLEKNLIKRQVFSGEKLDEIGVRLENCPKKSLRYFAQVTWV
jgi:hypothetical protein